MHKCATCEWVVEESERFCTRCRNAMRGNHGGIACQDCLDLQAEVERLKGLVVSWANRLDAGGADETVWDEIFDERSRMEGE